MLFQKKYNILVLGHKGMLGHDVYKHFVMRSQEKNSHIGVVTGFDKGDGIDFLKRHALGDWMLNSIHYDYCINCIAYTDTNSEENTETGRIIGYKLNALIPKYIAESCEYHKTKLIHISTDYVFSEFIQSTLLNEFCTFDTPFPKNNYGMHKLLGEKFIQESMSKKNYAILRVSWLIGAHNNKSFVHKFLKNVFKIVKDSDSKIPDKDAGKYHVQMTSNEYSVPTTTEYVINCINKVIDLKIYGIQHAVPGVPHNGISRVEFATDIIDCILKTPQLMNIKYNDNRIILDIMSKIVIDPIDRETYQPKKSTMSSSIIDTNKKSDGYSFLRDMSYKIFLTQFMIKYGKEIIEYSMKGD